MGSLSLTDPERREDVPELERVCRFCDERKPLHDFTRTSGGAHTWQCVTCNAKQVTQARDTLAKARDWRLLDAGRIRVRAGYGVSPKQADVVNRLREAFDADPRITGDEAAKIAGTSPSTASRILRVLRDDYRAARLAERAQAPALALVATPPAPPAVPVVNVATPPAPAPMVATALTLDFGPSYPTYTVDEFIALADAPAVWIADGLAVLYMPGENGPRLYVLDADRPHTGALAEPVGTAWINLIGRMVSGQDKPLRGRAWFQSREK